MAVTGKALRLLIDADMRGAVRGMKALAVALVVIAVAATVIVVSRVDRWSIDDEQRHRLVCEADGSCGGPRHPGRGLPTGREE